MITISPVREEKAVGSLLAAAVGDALGWPFEGRARRSQSGARGIRQPAEFLNWIRGGSRSEPYREPIGVGEYSDDTQLLLSTARSILHGDTWWEHFARVELPFWQVYERGGGGATKRAAQCWLAGKAPWASSQNRDKYFDAGGNGVAMRILPHLLTIQNSNDAYEASRQIILNGICTHGHPRALVGALLHGMTLWVSLRQEGMLEFGALAQAVRQNFPEWAQLREAPSMVREIFSDSEFRDYQTIWDETIRESMMLVEIALDGLRLGPLSAGAETLQKMGALNPKTNGSGTITAASALFLASRYAATPLQGVQVASTTIGADTDTVASMCGSILGAIHGDEWLGHFSDSVQDSRYIRKMAVNLVSKPRGFTSEEVSRVTKQDCSEFENYLGSLSTGSEIRLPDGRQGSLVRVDSMFSETAQADLYVIKTRDEQTLAIKRIVSRRKILVPKIASPTHDILRVGIKIFVGDLTKAKKFYVEKLGLPMVKEYATGFTVAEVISVLLANLDEQINLSFHRLSTHQPIPCIRVTNIESLAAKFSALGVTINQLSEHRSIKAFRVFDPFGNEIEFFEGR